MRDRLAIWQASGACPGVASARVAVLFVLLAAATPYRAPLADISMRRGEFLNSLVAVTANLAFIPLGTVGPRHPQVRVYACEVPS